MSDLLFVQGVEVSVLFLPQGEHIDLGFSDFNDSVATAAGVEAVASSVGSSAVVKALHVASKVLSELLGEGLEVVHHYLFSLFMGLPKGGQVLLELLVNLSISFTHGVNVSHELLGLSLLLSWS